MTQIDELIAVMMARRADALILNSGQPAQLDFNGAMADGATVPAHLLREMLRDIVPAMDINRLHYEGVFEFSYTCRSGLMDVQVERRGFEFHVVITPHTSPNVFVPPADTRPIYRPYQPPVDAGFVTPSRPIYTPPTLPGYPNAPMSSGGGTPKVQNSTMQNSTFPAPLSRTIVSKTKAKPTVNLLSLLANLIMFWVVLGVLLPLMGDYWWAFMLILAGGVALDAHSLGVRPGLLGGWGGKMSAASWFLVCLLCGFIGIPAYLAARPVYKDLLSALASTSQPPP